VTSVSVRSDLCYCVKSRWLGEVMCVKKAEVELHESIYGSLWWNFHMVQYGRWRHDVTVRHGLANMHTTGLILSLSSAVLLQVSCLSYQAARWY